MSESIATTFTNYRTMADMLRYQARRRAQHTAMIFAGRRTTYAELDARSNQQAQALLSAGLDKQDRVAILAKNSDQFFELNFACWKTDTVLVPVNFRLAGPEIKVIVDDALARVLFVGREFYEAIDSLQTDLPNVETIVALDGGHPTWPSFDDWYSAQKAIDPHLDKDPDATCMQLYSSGTTGLPKGVEITHANILYLLPVAIEDWGRWHEDDVSMVAMPLFHIAGCEWAYLAFSLGATNVVMAEVDPGQILNDIGEHGVTQTLFVPAVILFLLQHPDCGQTNFSSIKSIVYGASPIPLPLLQQAVETMDCDFAQVYGLTETTGAVTYLSPEEHDGTEKMKSCGRVMRSAEIKIVNEDGETCATGVVGEILIRSKQNMKGYWRRPEATSEAVNEDGWFHSGDAGYLDAEGYLYVHDRVKDMIISGGENIYPAEIESALAGHPALADVAIIGVPDDKWGEQVKAVVVLKPDAQLSYDELQTYARERLAGFKIPRSMEVIDELPRNPSGKILKRVLRAPYWEGRDRQVH